MTDTEKTFAVEIRTPHSTQTFDVRKDETVEWFTDRGELTVTGDDFTAVYADGKWDSLFYGELA